MKQKSSFLSYVALIGAAVLGIGWFLLAQPDAQDSSLEEIETVAEPTIPPTGDRAAKPKRDRTETGRPALAPVTPAPLANPAERSPLADTLHAPEQTGIEDLAIVLNLFERYREMFKGLPTGENNAQLVNALTGNNPLQRALLDRSHPAINPRGELTDRWGTPLFFHLVSREALEIRSAGPDKILWSQDDLLTQSASLREP